MQESRKQPKHKITKARLLMVGGVVVLLIAGVIIYFWLNRSVISKDVIKDVNFSVYAPQQAPSGYQINDNKTKLSGGTLSYVFESQSGNQEIAVTVQPKPASFDMSQMIDGGSISSTALSNGTLYDLSAEGSSRYLLDTGESLVFLTSSTSIDTATVNSLAADLKKLN